MKDTTFTQKLVESFLFVTFILCFFIGFNALDTYAQQAMVSSDSIVMEYSFSEPVIKVVGKYHSISIKGLKEIRILILNENLLSS